ncbi:hypothetical protein QTP88_023361 [Uroleucon formosanum]
MDLLSAWSMIDSVKLEIGQIHFDSILKSSINFSNNMNDLLLTYLLPLNKFRVETYQTIIDQITNSLNERFTDNNQLIADNKCQIQQIQHLANLANLDHDQLCLELKNFSEVYPKLKMSTIEKTKQIYRQFDTDLDTDNDEDNICSDTAFSCE